MKLKNQLILLALLSFYQYGFSQSGSALFDDTYIHDIQINSIEPFSYGQFHDSLYNSHMLNFYLTNSDLKNYYMASVVIDGVVIDTIGVRYKGNSTFENAYTIDKYALKLDFNEFVPGQKYDGLNKLNLNNNLVDPSCLRAKLSFEIMQRMGIVAPRTAFAKVYINGSYRGLYTMVEHVDKTFVKANFDPDNVGYLHKAYNFTVGLPSNGGYQDTSDTGLTEWTPLKTKKTTNDYQPLKDFIVAANNATDVTYENDIGGIFDLSAFIKLQAANMVLSDKDHYCAAGWNFYMYENPIDNRWYMIPWDYDLSFAVNGIVSDPANHDQLYSDNNYLTKRMMNIPSLKTQYRDAICEVINVGMDSTWINDRIITLRNLIATEVENDPHFWDIDDYNYYLDNSYTISEPGSGLDGFTIIGLREYINSRYNHVDNNLSTYGYYCDPTLGTQDVSLSSIEKTITYPNPTHGLVYLIENGLVVSDIEVYTLLGQRISNITINKIDAKTYEIDLSGLGSGMYVIKTKTTVKKVYKQ